MIIDKEINQKIYRFSILKRKGQRRIIIRRKEANHFLVTAPFYASKVAIDKAIDRHKEHLVTLPETINIKDKLSQDRSILIFGEPYQKMIDPKKPSHIDFNNQTITIKDGDNQFEIIKGLLKPVLLEAILRLSETYQKDFPLNDIVYRIQYMKSKYGSCQPIKKHISFNLELVHYPKYYLEYIFLHEATHLYYPNHSKAFYDHFAAYYPDFREIKKTLEALRKNFYNKTQY
jgi:predicted metal-dependent hydrolase